MTDAGFDIFDRTVPLDRINTEARQIRFGRGFLTVVAAVLVAIGWAAAKAVHVTVTTLMAVLMGIGYAAAWSAAAVKIGWQEGQKSAAARESRTAAQGEAGLAVP